MELFVAETLGSYYTPIRMREENKLRKIRVANNLTQEELSNQSGISIRTIQRLEKGRAVGSSHTLKALAKTLGTQPRDLMGLEENQHVEENETNKLKLLNFSILSVLLLPFGNLIMPALIFFKHRKNKNVNQVGRKIISFQIVSTLILFFLCVLIFLFMGRGNGAIPLPVFVCYSMIVIVNVCIVIRTSIEIDQKKEVLKFFPNLL